MKNAIIAELARIAGDRLTASMRVEIADCVIKVAASYNRSVAIAAVDTVKEKLVQQEAVENGKKKP